MFCKKNFGDLGRLKVFESKKKEILAAIDEAVVSGARLFKACEAIKLCVRRYRRWRKSTADNRGGYRAKNQALSEPEKTEIVKQFTSDGMCDLPMNIAHAKLMDKGIYLASASTCIRVMSKYYREMNRVVLYTSDELHLVKCNFIIYPSNQNFSNYSIPSFIA